MKTRLVRIGNSRGVRLPKPLIEEAGLSEEVEVRARRGSILILPLAGTRARRWGLFATPEETSPPTEIRELTAAFAASASRPRGFVRAVADPGTNAVHTWLLRGPRKLLPKLRAERDELALRARDAGPDALTPAEKRLLLSDAPSMQSLHEAVWRLPDPAAAARWGITSSPT